MNGKFSWLLLFAWTVLSVLLARFHGDWLYWALLIAWCLLQLGILLEQTDLYQPWRGVERKRDAVVARIFEIAQRHQDAGTLLPFAIAAFGIEDRIATHRDRLMAPGATGDLSALNDFARTFQPLLKAAKDRDGFEPVAYLAAAIRVCKDWVPGDEMREDFGLSLLKDLGDDIPELKRLVKRYKELYLIAKARRYGAALEDGRRRHRLWFRTRRIYDPFAL